MPVIATGEELVSLLRSARQIEIAFESLAEWSGYVDAPNEDFRSTLFNMITESQRHRTMVDSLISMVNASSPAPGAPLTPRAMDFKNKNEAQIMSEIGKYEKLAFDLYSQILQAVKESDLKVLLRDEKNANGFISTLEKLISEEKNHMDLAAKFSSTGTWAYKV